MTLANNIEDKPEPKGGKRLWTKIIFFAVIIIAWYILLQVSPLDIWLLNILAWIEALGNRGPFIFMLFYVPACVLMFPDVLPNAAAGAIWGVGIGTIVVSIGRMLGGTVTFLLARYLTKGWKQKRMSNDPKFAAITKAVERDGFRIVLLLRLCPLFPVIMLNYGLGMTGVRLRSYLLGTFLGMIPRTLFIAYSGSGVRSLVDLTAGSGINMNENPLIYWGGLAISLIIAAILANKARRLINEEIH